MHNSPSPTWVAALCRRVRELAFRERVLRNLFRGFRSWFPLLLAFAAFIPTPASAQGLLIPCTLLVQAAPPPNFLTITAVVNCVDPGGLTVTTTIDWGDGSSFNTDTGSLTVQHTYAVNPLCFIGNAQIPICTIGVTATSDDVNTGAVSAIIDLTAPPNPPPVFAGQSSVVQVLIDGTPAGLQVTFECTTVTDSSGGIHQAADLGITCDSNPPTIIFDPIQPQTVSIAIHTTGPASGSLTPGMRHGNFVYAVLLPLLASFLLGMRSGTARWRSGAALQCAGIGTVMILILMFSSCGGGFRQPQVVGQATPPGNYQVTIIDQPTPGQSFTDFVQTSLIVPLTVNQVQ
jgi:hypothetical protein